VFRHNGGGYGSGLTEMAVPPLLARPGSAPGDSPVARMRALAATRRAVGNPRGYRSTPLSAVALGASCYLDFIVRLANDPGKCQNQVHLACIIGTVPRVGTSGSG
jgi:hypothetical protein